MDPRNAASIARPQHPLPNEIRSMARDETVCKYCGVSYLIHAEVKALEERLQEAESELARCRGAEQREAELRAELQSVVGKEAGLRAELQSSNNREASLQEQLNASKKKESERSVELRYAREKEFEQKEEIKEFKREGAALKAEIETFRQKVAKLMAELQKASELEEQRKLELNALESLSKSNEKRMQETSLAVQRATAELSVQTQRAAELERVVLDNSETTSTYRSHLKLVCSKLSLFAAQAKLDRQSIRELKSEVVGWKSSFSEEIKSVTTLLMQKCHEVESGSAKYKSRLDSVNKEKQALVSEVKTIRSRLESRETRVSSLKEQVNSLEASLRSFDQLQSEYEVSKKQLTDQTVDLQKSLLQAQSDIQELSREREKMIGAYQNQIEMLKENYGRKLSDSERRRTKLEETLSGERMGLSNELNRLEEQLKKNFVMELKIEKEKHSLMVANIAEESRQSIDKLRAELTRVEQGSGGRSELLLMRNQLSRARESETTLRLETDSLKRIVADLDARLGRLNLEMGDENQLMELKTALTNVQARLSHAEAERNKALAQLQEAKQEIAFLHETVQSECEERSEMTDALSKLKEQLLQLRKPSMGYSANQSRSSNQPPPNQMKAFSPSTNRSDSVDSTYHPEAARSTRPNSNGVITLEPLFVKPHPSQILPPSVPPPASGCSRRSSRSKSDSLSSFGVNLKFEEGGSEISTGSRDRLRSVFSNGVKKK